MGVKDVVIVFLTILYVAFIIKLLWTRAGIQYTSALSETVGNVLTIFGFLFATSLWLGIVTAILTYSEKKEKQE